MANLKMKALMSIAAVDGRETVKRGEPFDALDDDEARRLENLGRAERVKAKPAAKDAKA